MRLFFVTPAYQRYEVSEICFKQRAHACSVMSILYGIDAQAVVVADDENLDIAVSFGMHTVKSPNDWLGRKFNDGIEYAYRNGADLIVPIGSDSWIDPTYFSGLSADNRFIQSANYFCAFDPLGEHRVDLFVEYHGNKHGVGPYVIPRYLIAPCKGRPLQDTIQRGCDFSTIKGMAQHNEINWVYRNEHFMQYTTFKSHDNQVTPFEKLINRHMVNQVSKNPFVQLNNYYPVELVRDVAEMYRRRREEAYGQIHDPRSEGNSDPDQGKSVEHVGDAVSTDV